MANKFHSHRQTNEVSKEKSRRRKKKFPRKTATSHAYLNFTLRLFYLNFYLLIYKHDVKEFLAREKFGERR